MDEKDITPIAIQRTLSVFGGKVLVALGPVFIYAIIQLIRLGNIGDYLFLLVGSFVSFAAMMGYIVTTLNYGLKKRKSYLVMFLTFCGYIPYLFGCYLVFIRGFWFLITTFHNFSIFALIEALIFIILGYFVVKGFYRITQIGTLVSKENFPTSN